MKKKNKKGLFVLAIAIISMVAMITLQANAVSSAKLDGIEYSSKDISEEKLEQIAKAIYGVYDGTPITSHNILCIFGHSTQTGTIQTTEHNYYTTVPKCKETLTRIEYCTRNNCDYFVTNGQIVNRVPCHY